MAVFPSPRAVEEFEAHLAYYEKSAPVSVALDFIDEYQAAKNRIALNPGAGSPRYAYLVPGVRHVSLDRFPFLVFYVQEGADQRIISVLHERSDIVTRL